MESAAGFIDVPVPPLQFLVVPLGIMALYAVTDLFLLPMLVWDLNARGQVHRVTLLGGHSHGQIEAIPTA